LARQLASERYLTDLIASLIGEAQADHLIED